MRGFGGITKQLLIMDKYKEIYDNTCKVQVEKVKLGDVNYYIQSKLMIIEELLKNAEDSQVYWKGQDNERLVSYAQGKIDAYIMTSETLKSLTQLINNETRY